MNGTILLRILPLLAALCSSPLPVMAVERLCGSDSNDVLQGSAGDDEIFGEAGDDLLDGGEGNDILYGGPGVDRLRGGPGADVFVFDFDATEVDEILDFDPVEGDEILIRHTAIGAKIDDSSLRFRTRRVDIEFDDAIADRVRISYRGDVEVRFENRDWTQLVKTGRSRLDLKLSHDGDKIRLRYSQKF